MPHLLLLFTVEPVLLLCRQILIEPGQTAFKNITAMSGIEKVMTLPGIHHQLCRYILIAQTMPKLKGLRSGGFAVEVANDN